MKIFVILVYGFPKAIKAYISFFSSEYHLKGYVADRQGEREDMQDAHTIIDDFTKDIKEVHDSMQVSYIYIH